MGSIITCLYSWNQVWKRSCFYSVEEPVSVGKARRTERGSPAPKTLTLGFYPMSYFVDQNARWAQGMFNKVQCPIDKETRL